MKGNASLESMDEFVFDKHYHYYTNQLQSTGGSSSENNNNESRRKRKRKKNKEFKETYDPSNVELFTGSWGEGLRYKEKMKKEMEERRREAEEEERLLKIEKEKEEEERKKKGEDNAPDASKKEKPKDDMNLSIFHGVSYKDSTGRSWYEPPKHLKPAQEPVQTEEMDPELVKMLKQDSSSSGYKKNIYKLQGSDHTCFLPKKNIHTWSHGKTVTCIRVFPNYGHLFLSGSEDGTVKIYDIQTKKCMLTYIGHEKGIKDICFAEDGSSFLTCSFDKYVRHWDTETGKCISKYTTDRIPYCVKFYPVGTPSTFLVGQSDKKVVQWDMREKEVVLEYDRHLAAVNTITFFDNNSRFVTTSDDKSIRVWDYGIPVDIKYIAEPYMHSMPSVTPHPNKKYLLFQSLDNKIYVYNAGDKFTLHKRKVFSGHTIAGYACRIGVSNDGKFVMSGDSSGNICFWDWKTTRLLTKIKAHDKVAIDCVWHPTESSKILTGGWDGKIKLWD